MSERCLTKYNCNKQVLECFLIHSGYFTLKLITCKPRTYVQPTCCIDLIKVCHKKKIEAMGRIAHMNNLAVLLPRDSSCM